MMGTQSVPWDVQVFATPEATVEALAERLFKEIGDAVRRHGRCRLALAGGSTPKKLYERLATPEARERIPWEALEVFFGDERCVAPGDPQSNYRMAREALLDHVPLPPEAVHPVNGLLPPEEAARTYAAFLGTAPLHVVLLGMGDDGHTASLFPDTPGLLEEGRPVVATRSPAPPHDRVSLSLASLCAAHAVLFLVTGASKAPAFARVVAETLSGARHPALPAALVRPESGRLTWHIDAAAARDSPYALERSDLAGTTDHGERRSQ